MKRVIYIPSCEGRGKWSFYDDVIVVGEMFDFINAEIQNLFVCLTSTGWLLRRSPLNIAAFEDIAFANINDVLSYFDRSDLLTATWRTEQFKSTLQNIHSRDVLSHYLATLGQIHNEDVKTSDNLFQQVAYVLQARNDRWPKNRPLKYVRYCHNYNSHWAVDTAGAIITDYLRACVFDRAGKCIDVFEVLEVGLCPEGWFIRTGDSRSSIQLTSGMAFSTRAELIKYIEADKGPKEDIPGNAFRELGARLKNISTSVILKRINDQFQAIALINILNIEARMRLEASGYY